MRKTKGRKVKQAQKPQAELSESGRQALDDWKQQVLNAPSMSAIAPIAEKVGGYRENDRGLVLRRLARELKDESLPLFRELAKSKERAVLLDTLEGASQVPSDEAVEIVTPLAEDGAGDAEVRKAARRALQRLRSLGVKATVPVGAGLISEAAAPERFQESLVSGINGLGQRMVSLAQRIPGHGIAVMQIAVDDSHGVYDCATGVTRRRNYDTLVEAMRRDETRPIAEVPREYALLLLKQAQQLNTSTQTPLPESFEEVQSILGETEKEFSRPIVYDTLDAEEARDNKLLLSEGEKLLQQDAFWSWVIPRERVGPILQKLKEAGESWVVVPEAAQKDRVSGIIREGLDEFFDEAMRAKYQRRLEEMSWILLENGKPPEARAALATALAIAPGGSAPSSIPFFTALMQRSLELASSAGAQQASEAQEEASKIIVPFRDMPQAETEHTHEH